MLNQRSIPLQATKKNIYVCNNTDVTIPNSTFNETL